MVVAFPRSIPLELKTSIDRVCAGMYEGYANAVRMEMTW
jgi:hypothetical protein